MTKLLTEQELHDKITELRKIRSNHLIDESDYTDQIITLINEQKLAHADMVIGKDEPVADWSRVKHPRMSGYGLGNDEGRNQLRAEQRQRNKAA